MNTFVTDAGPDVLEKLAGVKWRAPTVECMVRFGEFAGRLVGIEACGKLWAVHSDDQGVSDKLSSCLEGFSVFGEYVWAKVTGVNVPHIAGGTVDELVDGAAACVVGSDGKKRACDEVMATAKLTAAREGGKR
jgi:hypothetical protein